MIVWVSVVLRRTVWGDIDWRFDNLSGSHHQSQVNCESSVDVISLWSLFWLVDKIVSQCHLKQSFSGLHSPGRSQFTELWYDSWVQTIYSFNKLLSKEALLVMHFHYFCATIITVWGCQAGNWKFRALGSQRKCWHRSKGMIPILPPKLQHEMEAFPKFSLQPSHCSAYPA